MDKLRAISMEIQVLREHVQSLISTKDSLLDPEILAASRMLDCLLNEYDKLLIEKIKKSKNKTP